MNSEEVRYRLAAMYFKSPLKRLNMRLCRIFWNPSAKPTPHLFTIHYSLLLITLAPLAIRAKKLHFVQKMCVRDYLCYTEIIKFAR